MELKAVIKSCGLVALLSCSLSVFASNEKIKCPSVNFVKSNYSDILLTVKQEYQEPTKFFVQSNQMLAVEDVESNREWTVDVFVNTVQAYDFTEAYKNAKSTLANIVKADSVYAENYPDAAACAYSDNNGNISVMLSGYKIIKNHK
jgi:hypothetical protein